MVLLNYSRNVRVDGWYLLVFEVLCNLVWLGRVFRVRLRKVYNCYYSIMFIWWGEIG